MNEKEELKNEILKLGVERKRPNNMFSVLVKPLNNNILTLRQKQYFREKINSGRPPGLTSNFVLKSKLTNATQWYFLDPYDFKNKAAYNAYVKEIKKIKKEYPRIFELVYDFVDNKGEYEL